MFSIAYIYLFFSTLLSKSTYPCYIITEYHCLFESRIECIRGKLEIIFVSQRNMDGLTKNNSQLLFFPPLSFV